ncbi:MAG: 3-methyl-2-oxobutanoate hydroxymethyltransferase [Candidatus Dadabacteria bacterium]|nr:MAG: 3-methyl-2-oxobutanoate hydroxymethyltransferase [Candidatus Dadabacteria bacterium]
MKNSSVTVPQILSFKSKSLESFSTPLQKKIVALTAYDYLMAKLIDSTEAVDIILVGDSVSTVFQGKKNTLPVTLEEMIYHCRCVVPAVKRALVVGDMPFLSYQVSLSEAVRSAGRLIKEGGVSAVKLEGGENVAEIVAHLVKYDIPVMGHIGLTPQSYHRMGGYKIQGKKTNSPGISTYERILDDALALEKAGVFSIVLEGIPKELAKEITDTVSVPTIGIGAGPECDGQILVTYDLLGMDPDFKPKFVKQYLNGAEVVRKAINEYAREVRGEIFPDSDHSFSLQNRPYLKKKAL